MRSDARKRAADHTPGSGERRAAAYYREHGWSGCAGSDWDQLATATQDGWRHAADLAARRRADEDGLRALLAKHRQGFRDTKHLAPFYCTGCDWTAVVVADGRDGNGVTIEDQHLDHLAAVLARRAAEPGAQEAG